MCVLLPFVEGPANTRICITGIVQIYVLSKFYVSEKAIFFILCSVASIVGPRCLLFDGYTVE
jgi:hypothetical protein